MIRECVLRVDIDLVTIIDVSQMDSNQRGARQEDRHTDKAKTKHKNVISFQRSGEGGENGPWQTGRAGNRRKTYLEKLGELSLAELRVPLRVIVQSDELWSPRWRRRAWWMVVRLKNCFTSSAGETKAAAWTMIKWQQHATAACPTAPEEVYSSFTKVKAATQLLQLLLLNVQK